MVFSAGFDRKTLFELTSATSTACLILCPWPAIRGRGKRPRRSSSVLEIHRTITRGAIIGQCRHASLFHRWGTPSCSPHRRWVKSAVSGRLEGKDIYVEEDDVRNTMPPLGVMSLEAADSLVPVVVSIGYACSILCCRLARIEADAVLLLVYKDCDGSSIGLECCLWLRNRRYSTAK